MEVWGGRRVRERRLWAFYTVVAGLLGREFFSWLSRACACESVQHRFGPNCSVKYWLTSCKEITQISLAQVIVGRDTPAEGAPLGGRVKC
jgi:hypothetical protein